MTEMAELLKVQWYAGGGKCIGKFTIMQFKILRS